MNRSKSSSPLQSTDITDDHTVHPDAEGNTASAASEQKGTEVIKHFWRTLPNAPGVYRMFDQNHEVLYVGKAKNLKNRVSSYTRETGHSNRIARMIAETVQMEFITTETETEALLLESNLIKQLRPRYNVLMRDDKSFPYILLATDHEAPQLSKHRGARNRKGYYFGPFANVLAVDRTISALQKAFLLRTCTDSYYANRNRPCLLFQIKRCSGPCTDEISKEDYKILVQETRDFLSGKSTSIRERLSREMQVAAQDMEYEAAARLRDRIAALSAIQGSQDINTQHVEEADVFAINEQAGQFCIEVFFFRNWQNWGNRAYFPKADKSLSQSDVLNAFLSQFYADKPAAKMVLLSQDIDDKELLHEALSSLSGHQVDISIPQRGERKRLVDYAERNAREALSRKLAETASQEKLLQQLVPIFHLKQTPRRIEVYDNSHISGTNAIGAMIVAGASGFMKTHYRTFNIKSEELSPGDDFGMMKEVLTRRFSRLIKENPKQNQPEADLDGDDDTDAFPAWPDLVLIDGGKGQLEAVREALEQIGLDNPDLVIAGIAKGKDREAGRETFFIHGKAPFKLPPRDPALYFIQRLRDEAHRFAIGTHRAKRKKALVKNPLDDIPGIGPSRKRLLLLHFGTAKAIERASLEDLKRIPGINAQLAQIIFDHFRPG